MNPNNIRATIAEKAQAAGLDPSGPLGYADLLGFGKRYNSKGRVGILGVPEGAVEDKDKFFANPMAQIDAGIELMRQEKEKGGNDFSALLGYTQDPAATVRAMIRGAKYSGQPLTPNMIMQAAEAAGVEIDPIEEARKAGVDLQEDPPQEMAQPEQAPQAPQAMQNAMAPEMMEEQPLEMAPESTEDQRKSRLQQAFGARGKTSGLSDELNTYLRKMI
jgi:hypothetical protein